MAQEWVTIKNPANGLETSVTRTAYENVWKRTGHKLVERKDSTGTAPVVDPMDQAARRATEEQQSDKK